MEVIVCRVQLYSVVLRYWLRTPDTTLRRLWSSYRLNTKSLGQLSG